MRHRSLLLGWCRLSCREAWRFKISRTWASSSSTAFHWTAADVTSNNPEADPSLNLIDHLIQRGLVKDITDRDGLLETLQSGTKTTVYCGADPTAISLHVGNLVPLLGMLHFGIRGHEMIGLIGGATVEVGDPSGRDTERVKLENDVKNTNETSISQQMERLLKNGIEYARSKGYIDIGPVRIVNNATWWKDMSFLEFMGMVGRHLRVQEMLKRQSVQKRITSEAGIGYNEFTYQALQAYDFFHLHKKFGCKIQFGGSDQYGNIASGVDLTSRLQFAQSLPRIQTFGVTTPLLTTATGEKLGKSAGNAVWLDPALTSPFALYQYFVRLPDADVEKYLRILTLLPLSEIAAIVAKHGEDPSLRIGQHALGKEVTDIVHGLGFGEKAYVQSRILYSTPSEGIDYSADQIIDAFKNDSQLKALAAIDVVNERLIKVIQRVASNRSMKSIRELVNSGGVYVGPRLTRVDDVQAMVQPDWLINGRLLIIRLGKADMQIIKLD
ncbi:hypothetical protein POJ06DRAFT_256254 [Lipomyces tetrasporus]|uniref:Tyrosine--tRNA ligase n=1 Tax=Lipomyces tetrasporus TaxID=54092 RepID=A0AAD7QQL1_9ASCO|nr:uncharacterized protein POJ06DRAFT_256254 [Lipomyces tetrasporus]KAJ8099186.1 hypothetical protein POJ06DRAFT_256254 [Lipomyces tetrasporus]